MGTPVTVDFDQEEGREFRLIPNGTYSALVSDAQLKEGPKGDYIMLRFTIDEGEYTGENVFENISLVPAALWRSKATLRALMGDELPTDGKVTFDVEELVGRGCRVSTEQRSYQGEMRNGVRAVLPPFGEAASDLFEEEEDDEPTPPKKAPKRSKGPTKRGSRRRG